MATAKTLNRGRALLLALPLGLTACTGVTSLSEEELYSDMIGQCYVLQQDMKIHENGCWSLGGLILSPDESYCFKGNVSDVEQGAQIRLFDIRQQQWGSAGFCPQAVVKVKGTETSGREVFIPLCFSNDHISWLEDPLWQRGDAIRLREEYVLPCGN
ncbi:hypothetical protein [Aliidiomarina iranensis]|uniref:hypothetical protein n=1 Tax=Aliidiomarina iranensis TaxID=1434071 RepID=UPI000F89681A|nr:hypothetical protein [Aliidiomarina iranensis]